MLICSLLFMFAATAQRHQGADHRNSQKRVMKDATPEEMASLRSKKLTLDLDLSAAQQAQVKTIELARANEAKALMAERKEKNQLSKEEVMALRSARLDRAIAYKREMKAVLNAAQYEKWEKRMRVKGRKMRGEAQNKRKKGKTRH